jgi:uncharacterized protein YkwD
MLSPADTARAATPEAAVEAQINAVRAAHGLPTVSVSRSLEGSARAHSLWMMARDYFGHGARIRASGRFRPVGEVVEMHWGRQTRPASAVSAWMRSASHRSLLLNPAFRYVGAGQANGRFRGRRAHMWTVHLGAPPR